MCGKGYFSKTLFATLFISSIIQVTFAAKEELDQRILSPKSDEFQGGDEMPNFLADGVVPDEDRWWFPCVPPSYYDAILSQNIHGEYPDTVKRTFQPWGGKRARFTDYFHRLSNWGGKRDPSGNTRSIKNDVPTARRSTFNPWGG